MTTETDQTAGQLDEATVLRVLEMIHEYGRDQHAQGVKHQAEEAYALADIAFNRSMGSTQVGDRLVAMYRASLGLEEA